MLRYLIFLFASLLVFFTPFLGVSAFEVTTVWVSENRITQARKWYIMSVLTASSFDFANLTTLKISLDATQKEPRGRMQGQTITLSPYVIRDSEFLKLTVHELAHYIDIYVLRGAKWEGDPSESFYQISWLDKTTKRAGQGMGSFVSGYAASNKYEDFAESFVFYMFHNEEFAHRSLKSEVLRQKYLFFAKKVFPDGKFQGTEFRNQVIPDYLWDTTKVSISVKKYLNSL